MGSRGEGTERVQPGVHSDRGGDDEASRHQQRIARNTGTLTLMKVTIEIPDERYRKVKAKSALQGRPIRAVTIELFERWFDDEEPTATLSPAQTLDDWFRLADDIVQDAPTGP